VRPARLPVAGSRKRQQRRLRMAVRPRPHACDQLNRQQNSCLTRASIARSSLWIASKTLPTSLQWYRARRSVLCARRSWRFGDRCRFKKRELRGCHVLQAIFFSVGICHISFETLRFDTFLSS
jgi:hypothetical protein